MIVENLPTLLDDPEYLARYLESLGDYRILRRLKQSTFRIPHLGPSRRALFVDVETTGLDADNDSVIELAMLPFDYDSKGIIVGVGEPFDGFCDPGTSIPASVSQLTGITDEMVRGKHIDPAEVDAIVRDAAIVIAHNAGFDRPFCQRKWPIFEKMPWACSLREVDWAAEGFEGKRLSQIAAGFGFFFDAHRAVDDCLAGVEILSRNLPRSGETGLAALLRSARTSRWRVWAEGAPYARRDILKQRGYRWNMEGRGVMRAWSRDVEEEALEEELQYLRREIYQQECVAIPRRLLTAFDRYSFCE